MRSKLLTILLSLIPAASAIAQVANGGWSYKVDGNGVRNLHVDSQLNLFGKEIPVRLRFICRPEKRGVIGIELIVSQFEQLPQFHFKEFDEWESPNPKTADIEFVVITGDGRLSFHDCPEGWPSAEIPGGFTFSSSAPVNNFQSSPRKVIDALLANAEGLKIIVSDKKHPPKRIRAYFSMAGSEIMLKSLTEGIR